MAHIRIVAFLLMGSLAFVPPVKAAETSPCLLVLTNPEVLRQRFERNILTNASRMRVEGGQVYFRGDLFSELHPELSALFGASLPKSPQFFGFYHELIVFFLGAGLDSWEISRSTTASLNGIKATASSSDPSLALLGDEVSVVLNDSPTAQHTLMAVKLSVKHRSASDSAILEAAISSAGDLARKKMPEFGALMPKRSDPNRVNLILLPAVFGPEAVDTFLEEVERQLWDNPKYRPQFQRRPLVRLVSSEGDRHTIEVRKKPDWQQ